jgi:hypothetical protein
MGMAASRQWRLIAPIDGAMQEADRVASARDRAKRAASMIGWHRFADRMVRKSNATGAGPERSRFGLRPVATAEPRCCGAGAAAQATG